MERLRFRSLSSGSNGNCYFVGNASAGILIDAGVSARSVRKFLRSMGLDFPQIWGIFITHDHMDHIRGVGALGEKHRVPIYTTANIHAGINRNYRVTQKLSTTSQHFIEAGGQATVGAFVVRAFSVSHDATESVGYSVDYQGKTVTFATDLGFVNEAAATHLTRSDCIILEANYDEQMLANGPYPPHLQQRIKADTGHLGNTQTAAFLAEHYTERWKHVFLCHLSRENNQPERALSLITERMKAQQVNFEENTKIIPLERLEPSAMYMV